MLQRKKKIGEHIFGQKGWEWKFYDFLTSLSSTCYTTTTPSTVVASRKRKWLEIFFSFALLAKRTFKARTIKEFNAGEFEKPRVTSFEWLRVRKEDAFFLECLPFLHGKHALYLSWKSEVRFVYGILSFFRIPVDPWCVYVEILTRLGPFFHYLNTIRTIWGKRAARNKINKSNCTSIRAFMTPYAPSSFLLSVAETSFQEAYSLGGEFPFVLELICSALLPSPVFHARVLLTRVGPVCVFCPAAFLSAPYWYESVAPAHLHILLWICPLPSSLHLPIAIGDNILPHNSSSISSTSYMRKYLQEK